MVKTGRGGAGRPGSGPPRGHRGWCRQALTAAARRAGLHDVLAALPRGYDTLLTRTYFDLTDRDNPATGVLLSGGQWQRLGLARALLRVDRDLLILDEPSSGLDAEAEHQIHTRLQLDRCRHATVLISHRLNTVRHADRIVVLADGVISEQGRHDTLMARAGEYARLFFAAAGRLTAIFPQGCVLPGWLLVRFCVAPRSPW